MLDFWMCSADKMMLKNTSRGLRLIGRLSKLRRLTEKECINQKTDHFSVIFHIVALILLRIAIHPGINEMHANG